MKNWKYIVVWPKSCDYQTEIFTDIKKVDGYLLNYELREQAQIYKLVPVPTPKRHGMGRPGYERTAGTVKKGGRGGK